MSNDTKKALRFSAEAMNTDFTIFIDSEEQNSEEAGGAAQAVFEELERIEQALSRFVTWSDISKVNALQPGESYQLGVEALSCLTTAAAVAAETDRAFDPAAGVLIDFWKGRAGTFLPADYEQIPEWKAAWEEHRRGEFTLDPDSRLIQCATAGSKLDLGAIGKGFALDEMARLLEDEWQIHRALLSAGGSTVLALDSPLSKPGWKIGFGGETQLPYLLLTRRALSTSGTANQPTHLVDPRTGHVVTRSELIRAVAPTGAQADALSTAFFVMSREEVEEHCSAYPGHIALFAVNDEKGVPLYFDIPHANGDLEWEDREEKQ
jgi:thiamine biosynthesis lipoprotein